jgi:hypothetical protein
MSKLYHYTKLSTAIEFILPTMTLRTNFLNKMNGPKENQRWAFGSVNVPYEELYPEINLNPDENIAHFESQYQLGEDIKSQIQAICFVYSDKYFGYENEMMWAQYTENHHGICLEIDTDLFLEENKDTKIFKFQNINYNPKKENTWIHWDLRKTKTENINQHIERDFEALFLSKSHYWKKEFEKRLLILEKDYCFLKMKQSLTGIYYGLFTNHHYDKSVQQLINPEITESYRVYFEDNRLKRMERRK